MSELTPTQVTEYFRRCFVAADGLWFMEVEEAYDFDKALAIDVGVWRVLPKVQARAMKEFTGLHTGLAALRECMRLKLEAEGYVADISDRPGGGFSLRIQQCPWLAKLRKAKREHLADSVGRAICPAEYGAWAAEFGVKLDANSFGCRLCAGNDSCEATFVE
jgi:hypothetical protein